MRWGRFALLIAGYGGFGQPEPVGQTHPLSVLGKALACSGDEVWTTEEQTVLDTLPAAILQTCPRSEGLEQTPAMGLPCKAPKASGIPPTQSQDQAPPAWRRRLPTRPCPRVTPRPSCGSPSPWPSLRPPVSQPCGGVASSADSESGLSLEDGERKACAGRRAGRPSGAARHTEPCPSLTLIVQP